MTTRKEIIEFALLMGRETTANPYHVAKMLKLSATHHRLCETACNRELTAKEEVKMARVETALMELTWTIVASGVCISHDPRGATIKLRVKSGFTNDWGKEGICVPV